MHIDLESLFLLTTAHYFIFGMDFCFTNLSSLFSNSILVFLFLQNEEQGTCMDSFVSFWATDLSGPRGTRQRAANRSFGNSDLPYKSQAPVLAHSPQSNSH